MQAWENFLALQEKELGKETIKKWLRPLKVVRFDACNLYLEASDSFQALWFEEHMRQIVQHKLVNNNSKQIKIHLSIVSAKENDVQNEKPKRSFTPSASHNPKFYFDAISPYYRWDNYTTSQKNLLPAKLLSELSGYDLEKKQSCQPLLNLNFNPIYLYGKTGTGKTHLLMSVASCLEQSNLKVIYTRAETFTEHVVNAIRSGEMQHFRRAYRNIDVLLIDDIEVFSRKSATQEELFHTFNTLHVEGKQIILTSSCPPQDLKFIEPRLVSRFEWGIVLPLHPLEPIELHKVLQEWTLQMNYPLQNTVIDFLLDTFAGNTKSLRRALDALVLRTNLDQSIGHAHHLPLNLNIVKSYLSDLIQEKQRSVLTSGRIIQTVAEYYGIKVDDILSKSQNRECTLPRQIAMHLCRHHLNLPYMKIGDIFVRDHSTVMSSVKHIQKEIEAKNSEIAGSINGILKKLEV